MLDAVFLAETIDHANWVTLGALTELLPDGALRRAFEAAVGEVEAARGRAPRMGQGDAPAVGAATRDALTRTRGRPGRGTVAADASQPAVLALELGEALELGAISEISSGGAPSATRTAPTSRWAPFCARA